jgi:hypothetical protein
MGPRRISILRSPLIATLTRSAKMAHELDTGPLEHIDLPADPAQERSREQARHGATDDNSTATARH